MAAWHFFNKYLRSLCRQSYVIDEVLFLPLRCLLATSIRKREGVLELPLAPDQWEAKLLQMWLQAAVFRLALVYITHITLQCDCFTRL